MLEGVPGMRWTKMPKNRCKPSVGAPGYVHHAVWRVTAEPVECICCRRTDISELLQWGTPTPADAAKVTKAVYASPMNVQVRTVPLGEHSDLHLVCLARF